MVSKQPISPGKHYLNMLVMTAVMLNLPLFGLLAYNGPKAIDSNQYDKSENKMGYWGPATSNVNWCERDYTMTYYVAEFWNTLSSFSICVLGLYGFFRHYSFMELRFVVAFTCFFVVGVGSMAFHGTLLKVSQSLDELPMIWGNGIFYYILRHMEDERGVNRSGRAMIILLVVGLQTAAILKFDTEDQNVFLLCYGSGVVYACIHSSRYNQKYSHGQLLLLEISTAFYMSGLAVWLVERNFCSLVHDLYLHAWWHVFAGTGTFCLILFWIHTRQQVLKENKYFVLKGSTPFNYWIDISKA